ncbi:RraA family protein [Pseudonocardia thermophila]|uniref:RraA family protein n=1 Tax=Pseudonocardia thermophila TaxID=1848 RepID=UPI00248D4574|nr:RraA family protein [Pseudonocardia thermophila]
MSPTHPDQWSIGEPGPRPDPALLAALGELATTQLADSDGPVAVAGPGIARIAGGREVCGPAVTVWTKPGDVVYVLKAVDHIRPGDVLVVDGGGRLDAAVIGDIVAGALVGLGCAGLVVDGVGRDVDGMDATGLPTFARGAHPAVGSKTGPGAINVPVQIGGAAVRPGDLVRADSSGVVVVPHDRLAEAVEAGRVVAEREQEWRRRIATGEPLPEATGIDEALARLRP